MEEMYYKLSQDPSMIWNKSWRQTKHKRQHYKDQTLQLLFALNK